MMKNILFLLTITLLAACKTQKSSVIEASRIEEIAKQTEKINREKYAASIKDALVLYEQKDFVNSAEKFQEAFAAMDGKVDPNDRYTASCAYSLAGIKDKAFYHLFRLARESKYSNLEHLTINPDFDILHQGKKWEELIAIVKRNKEDEERELKRLFMEKLEKLYIDDQWGRKRLPLIEEKYGPKSEEMDAQWNLIHEMDSLNLIEVQKILDSKGWLGQAAVGKKGNLALFLVIQHADLATQLKYLPMMREAVKKGNARLSNLALLEDRVALRQGKRQIYGSQIYTDSETNEKYVAPLIDPENVDKRRSAVGLGKLADSVKRWNMVWDVEKHKKRIAKIEARGKENN